MKLYSIFIVCTGRPLRVGAAGSRLGAGPPLRRLRPLRKNERQAHVGAVIGRRLDRPIELHRERADQLPAKRSLGRGVEARREPCAVVVDLELDLITHAPNAHRRRAAAPI